MKTPEQIEAAITRLMLQTSAIEAMMATMASVLTTEQIRQVRDRAATISVLQEVADGPRSTPMAQDLVQPALNRLHEMLQGAHRQFSKGTAA